MTFYQSFYQKTMSRWALFKILLMSAAVFKQWLLHKNEIVQYIQSCKHQDVNQGRFRKSLQGFTNVMKNK